MSEFARSLTRRNAHAATAPIFLQQFFDQSARQWPQRIALEIPPGANRPQRRQLSYAELNRQADAVATFLRAYVGGECVVAILLPRGNEYLYISQLGVLKAGAAYTCIDRAFPDEQVRDILTDADAVALLTDSEGVERARRAGWLPNRVFDIAEVVAQLLKRGAPEPAPIPDWLTPESLAYVIYTSGTTGRPKGVMIEHRGIVNLVDYDREVFKLKPEDRVSQNSSPSYDSSVEETWFAFAAG
ncbi:MAG TPA: AMP-binding protein, partial [Blastocatellia bacterium]|nr:AMP-binding protein [Blastocatellia bacterium]